MSDEADTQPFIIPKKMVSVFHLTPGQVFQCGPWIKPADRPTTYYRVVRIEEDEENWFLCKREISLDEYKLALVENGQTGTPKAVPYPNFK